MISQREHELILDSRKILNSKTILIRSLTEENSKILLTSAWSRRSRKEFLLTSAQIPRASIIQDRIWAPSLLSIMIASVDIILIVILSVFDIWQIQSKIISTDMNVISIFTLYHFWYSQKWVCLRGRGNILHMCPAPPWLLKSASFFTLTFS